MMEGFYMYDQKLIHLIKKYNSLSIIGMDKNVGKTTVLNFIINNIQENQTPLGLTSIGRDGEEIDGVTNTEKPKIYVRKGTLLATAKQCLYTGDITREILETTGINTPMGEVIIARALSDGYVELGGPSVTASMSVICKRLRDLGSELVLVDGALSRKTLASPSVTEAAILATGAALSNSMEAVVEKTKHAVDLMSTEAENDKKILDICTKLSPACRITVINKDYSLKTLNCITALEASREIVDNIDNNTSHIFIRGVISSSLIEAIMKVSTLYNKVTFLAEDGTKLFLSKDTLLKFKRAGGSIKVLSPIKIICLTCNPTSPYGYTFDGDAFRQKLQSAINIPVI
jgi:hypothetical protein